MFRYSRDVKRCGPGTNAGAPVGVVYCLSTSSFFILTLTPELDVSSVRYRHPRKNVAASAPAASTDLWARHCKPDHCEIAGPGSGHVLRQYSPASQQSLFVPPLIRGGCRVSGLPGLEGRPCFGKTLAHPIKNDPGRF